MESHLSKRPNNGLRFEKFPVHRWGWRGQFGVSELHGRLRRYGTYSRGQPLRLSSDVWVDKDDLMKRTLKYVTETLIE